MTTIIIAALWGGLTRHVFADDYAPITPTEGGAIDLPMLDDPPMPNRDVVIQFDPACKLLWVEAMKRPEFDLRLDAIAAIVDAHDHGVAGLEDLVPLFVDRLNNDSNRYVRLAAARALAAFDDRGSAADLLKAGQDKANIGMDMIAIVDPALASWDYRPARAVWIDRLAAPEMAQAPVMSGMRCLGVVGDEEAIEPLLRIVDDRTVLGPLRLTAAEALGAMTDSRIRAAATSLAGSDDAIDRLLAVRMLASDQSAEAQAVLVQLASDEPIVAGPALAALNRIDPNIVATRFPDRIHGGDPNVRLEVVAALARTPASGSVTALGSCLSDADTRVRRSAREALVHFSNTEALRDEVLRVCKAELVSEDWRTLEQAALIVGALDMKECADRLIELLAQDRPEVRLAAASSLRRLNIESTLPAITDRVRLLTDLALESGNRPAEYRAIGYEATQLIMAIGAMRYRPAAELLKRYIPKHSGFDGMVRGSALYALGKIHENEPQPALSELFQERLADDTPIDPESAYVRRFAAIGLGRMKAADALDTLNAFYQADVQITSIAGACRWAIMQIEPGDLPPLRPVVERPGGYFLEPLGRIGESPESQRLDRPH